LVTDVKHQESGRASRYRNLLPILVQARRSVRGKLMLVVLVTTVIAVWVAGIAMLTYDLRRYQNTWRSDIAAEAAILAVSTAPALAFDDHAVAERNLAALRARPRVMAAALYSTNNRLYASFVREGEPAPPSRPPSLGVRTSGEKVELAQLVQRDGEVLGTIYLEGRYDLVGRIEAYLSIFALVTVLSLSVAFLLSGRLQKGITEPLDAMAAVARAIVNRRLLAQSGKDLGRRDRRGRRCVQQHAGGGSNTLSGAARGGSAEG
jgi:hypothetical protein